MNDASGEHVQEHVQALEAEVARAKRDARMRKYGGGGMGDEIQRQKPLSQVDPTRWWLASSAFPMMAGTLGPVASAFSICALVRPWRQHLPPGAHISQAQFINDPEWLIIINAVQLAIALVANLFLLLNMARKIRFTVAMPFTITGWYLSSITLIALTATAAGPIVAEPKEEHIWSQAFYYGVFSAVLYFIVSTLLVVTAWGANRGRYDKDFQLTTSQRTLMLQTIMFLMYLLIGALVFSTVEGWPYLDALYWADVTLFTVGFGDMGATTILGRALLFPYALVGVISLGLVIGSIRSLVLERGRRMLDARMVEKKRRNILRAMTIKGKDDILVPIRTDSGLAQPLPLPPEISPLSRKSSKLGGGGGGGGGGSGRDGGHGAGGGGVTTELERREQEFRLMRHIQRKAAKRRRWFAMAMSSGTWLVLWLVGACVLQVCEAGYQGWSYFDAVYFAFVSLTTIGYGDVTPVSNAGRAFFVFWSLLALPTTTVLISNAGDTVVKSIRDVTNQVGSITILPGEEGLIKDARAVLRTLSCGFFFSEDDDEINIEETPPGFLGQARIRRLSGSDDEEEEEEEANRNNDDADDEEAEAKSAEALDDEENVLRESSGANGLGGGAGVVASGAAATNSQGAGGGGGGGAALTRVRSARSARSAKSAKSATSTTTLGASGSGSGSGSGTTAGGGIMSPRGPDFLSSIPPKRADYLVLLADEILRVSQHLKHKPPRKYTFAEWAWYLRLMGEDERSAETHRQARPHVHGSSNNSISSSGGGGHHLHLRHGLTFHLPVVPHHHHRSGGGGSAYSYHPAHHEAKREGYETDNAGNNDDGPPLSTAPSIALSVAPSVAPSVTEDPSGTWSWVGSRSPLMGAQEEAEWIHEKLVMRLTAELRAARDEERQKAAMEKEKEKAGGGGDREVGGGKSRMSEEDGEY